MAASTPTPRPAKGFGTARAQKWVLTAALVTAIIYGFRRALEPSVQQAPARGGTAAKLTGAGSPPPALGHWAVAYGAGFMMLSMLAIAAPEAAGSVAMLIVAGSLLTNGTAIVADIGNLEKTNAPAATPPVPVTPVGAANVPAPGAGNEGAAEAGAAAV